MAEHETPPLDALALRVARLLRHEVGDLLQGVYASASVLLSRFGPSQALEHRLVSDLQGRAELLRAEMDGVVGLLDEAPARPGDADVAGLIQATLAAQRRAKPGLALSYEGPASCRARCDLALFPEALSLLLAALAQDSRAMALHLRPGPVVECLVEAQGRSPSLEQLAWLDAPFLTTRQPLLGVALASAARAIAGVGGVAHATRLEQGVAVRLRMPAVPENES